MRHLDLVFSMNRLLQITFKPKRWGHVLHPAQGLLSLGTYCSPFSWATHRLGWTPWWGALLRASPSPGSPSALASPLVQETWRGQRSLPPAGRSSRGVKRQSSSSSRTVWESSTAPGPNTRPLTRRAGVKTSRASNKVTELCCSDGGRGGDRCASGPGERASQSAKRHRSSN